MKVKKRKKSLIYLERESIKFLSATLSYYFAKTFFIYTFLVCLIFILSSGDAENAGGKELQVCLEGMFQGRVTATYEGNRWHVILIIQECSHI